MTNHTAKAAQQLDGASDVLASLGTLTDPSSDPGQSLSLAALAAATIANGHALLAIADALTNPPPPAGACTATLDVTTWGYERLLCEHPHGHTGAHQSTQNGTARWMDGGTGAGHLTAAPTTPSRATPPACKAPHPGYPANGFGYCIHLDGHGGPHQDSQRRYWDDTGFIPGSCPHADMLHVAGKTFTHDCTLPPGHDGRHTPTEGNCW